MFKKIKIRYFASMRDLSGIEVEEIEGDFLTGNDLYLLIQKKYNFPFNQNNLKLAINECYENFDYKLNDGDVVAFIPPVAGG